MSSEVIKYDDKTVIDTLKQTVAQGATDAEFAMFTQFCKSTGLNPFKKEIWFIKAGGRVQMMTGIQGYWAIANSHPQMDGHEEDIEVDAQGVPVKAVCKIYRKDRRFPSVGIALMKEYKKGSPIWSSMPSVMLMKCAESVALRKAFPQELNGLYTEEEMPTNFAANTPPPVLKTADEIAQAKEQPKRPQDYFWYALPKQEKLSKEQHEFLKRRNCSWDNDTGLWFCPESLGKIREEFHTECPYPDEGEATASDDVEAA